MKKLILLLAVLFAVLMAVSVYAGNWDCHPWPAVSEGAFTRTGPEGETYCGRAPNYNCYSTCTAGFDLQKCDIVVTGCIPGDYDITCYCYGENKCSHNTVNVCRYPDNCPEGYGPSYNIGCESDQVCCTKTGECKFTDRHCDVDCDSSDEKDWEESYNDFLITIEGRNPTRDECAEKCPVYAGQARAIVDGGFSKCVEYKCTWKEEGSGTEETIINPTMYPDPCEDCGCSTTTTTTSSTGPDAPEFTSYAGILIALIVVAAIAFLLVKKKQ